MNLILNQVPPEAIIENGKIINADKLRSYWQERLHREYILSRAWRDTFVPVKSEADNIVDRLDNLEAISAEPRRTPRKYEEKLHELRGQVLYLQNKVNAMELENQGLNNYVSNLSKETLSLKEKINQSIAKSKGTNKYNKYI